MRYSNTTLKELTARYRAVLKKCAIFNACLFLSFAVSGAAQATPVINVAEGITETVVGILADGQSGEGSVITNAGTLTVSGIPVAGSSNDEDAGNVIINNTSAGNGVIYNTGDLTLGGSVGSTTVVMENSATGKGGVIHNTADGTLTVDGISVFADNTATGLGGVIYSKGTATIGGSSTFAGNTSDSQGGAIRNEGTMDITGATFTNNKAPIAAGAVNTNNGNLTITNSSFKGNVSEQGGAVSDGTGNKSMTITGSTFDGNYANIFGGAVNSVGKDVTIKDSVFTNNKAGVDVVDENGNVIVGAMNSNNWNPEELRSLNNGGGAVYLNGATVVTMENVEFSGNEAGAFGGAIAARTSGTEVGGIGSATIKNATFTNNVAGVSGGAFAHTYNAKIDIENADFVNNTAGENGGAVYSGAGHSNTGAVIKGAGVITFSGENTFVGNTAGRKGGAVYNASNTTDLATGSMTFEDKTVFTNNTAGIGGAIYNGTDTLVMNGINTELTGGTMSFNGSTEFTNNKATAGNGGAIANVGTDSTLTMTGATNTFTNNSATGKGGAIYNEGLLTIGGNGSENTFASNSATGLGGAIFSSGTATIGSGATFTGNTSDSQGGAIRNEGTMEITDATFTNNKAPTVAGAVNTSTANGHLTVTDSTFKGNVSAQGGAISDGTSNASMTITGSTFDANYASVFGGAASLFGKNVVIKDSIFTNNKGGVDVIDESGNVIVEAENSNRTEPADKRSLNNGGGALFLGGTTQVAMENVIFVGNESGAFGGAIDSRMTSLDTGNGVGWATIKNATFTENTAGGSGGAIAHTYNAPFNIEKADFENNTAEKNGGAVYNGPGYSNTGNFIVGGGKMTFSGENTFVGNSAGEKGGAVYNSSNKVEWALGGVTFEDKVVFTNNTASVGGAVYSGTDTLTMNGVDRTFTGGTMVFNGNTEFENNQATAGNGGAIANIGADSTVTMTGANNTFINNSATGNGGAISNVAVGGGKTTLTINGDAEFRNNTATAGKGGAIYNEVINGTASDASLTVTGKTTFAKNTATEGGAIYNNGALDINGAGVKLFSQNTATAGNGGAIYMNTGDLAFEGNTIFTANSATGLGGAVYMNGGDMSFDGNNVFTANTSGGDGAAIYNNGGALTMTGTSNTFSGNTTQGDGGAIRNNKGTVSVTNGQFVANSALGAESWGGAIYHSPEKVVDENGNVITSTVLDIKDSVFKDNIATVAGGAIAEGAGAKVGNVSQASKSQTAISGSLFDGNHVGDAGGALALFRDIYSQKNNETDDVFNARVTQITDTTFTNNTAGVEVKDANGNTVLAENLNGDGGGAIYLGGGTRVAMDKVSFINNESASNGGAIAGRIAYYNVNGGGTLSASNATFVGNKAGKKGGAIYSQWDGSLSFANATFENNTAGTEGGAIYVSGQDYADDGVTQEGLTNISGKTAFVGNSAGTNGGALYNEVATVNITGEGAYVGNTAAGKGGAFYNGAEGTLSFDGTHTFSGNMAGTSGNDIHNEGTLNVKGTMILGGGISGQGTLTVGNADLFGQVPEIATVSTMSTGIATANVLNVGTSQVVQGTANFESGSTLMAALMNTSSHGALTAGTINATGADLKVTTIASAGRYVVVQGEGYDTFNEVQVENSLFHHDEIRDAETKSLIITTFGKTADDITDEFGTDETTSNILSELAGNASENEKVQEIISGIGTTTGDALNKELKKLSPTTAPITTGIATTVTRHIANAIAGQLEDVRIGRSGGEEEADVDMWVKVLASHADQGTSRTTDGFEGNTKGVAFGVDVKKDNTVVGFGYANTTSDVKSIGRRIDVEGHNLFAYAEYQPSEWYVRGLVNYGMSDYEEEKTVFGAKVDAEYDVTAISGEMTVGHEYANGVTPFGGLRFMHIAQESYTDEAGVRVNTDDVDIWTAVAGAKYSKDIAKGDKVYRPEVHAGVTYDLLSDTIDANVMVGDYGYIVETRRLPKFGIEAGFGLGIKVCDHIDVNFTYDANLRKDYTVHSGNVKLQYNF